MGCGSSKSTAVRDSTSPKKPKGRRGSSSIFNSNSNISININLDTDVNVFDSEDTTADLSTSIANGKPRLARSGIRRGPGSSFGPVISGCVLEAGTEADIECVEDTPDGFISTRLVLPSDSGLGETRANSEASDVQKTAADELTARLRHKSFSQASARTDSVGTGSILTPNALNASFRTCSENDNSKNLGFETSLGTVTPFSDVADFDQSTFRTLSVTPSGKVSLELTPIAMHEQTFGAIKEESEGGYTPRSLCHGDGVMPGSVGMSNKFLVREVLAHNASVKWEEWSMCRGKVYDNNVVNSVFSPLLTEHVLRKEDEYETVKAEWKLQQGKGERPPEVVKAQQTTKDNEQNLPNGYNDDEYGSSDNESDKDDDDDDDEMFSEDEFSDFLYEQGKLDEYENVKNYDHRKKRTLAHVVNSDLPKQVIHELLPSCCVGELEAPNSSRFLDDVRKDVKMVLDDLIRADSRDQLKKYEAELMKVLQRWIQKYRSYNVAASSTQTTSVGNETDFPLPDDIKGNPECLREWSETWQNFDTEVPEEGSWATPHVEEEEKEEEEEDIRDADEVFRSSLRNNIDPRPLVCDVDGEAAWDVIRLRLFENDVLTEEQKVIEDARRKRKDLHDPVRMKKRRVKILNYFVRQYRMDKSHVQHFLVWAEAMERGEKAFQKLCERGSV